MYCGKEKRNYKGKNKIFCLECGRVIEGDYYVLFYDYAIDAEDGYGEFDEICLCNECGADAD